VQKQDEVWDSLGRTTNLNPMAICPSFHMLTFLSSLLDSTLKIIPWGHNSQDFVQLGFSGGEEDDEYDEEGAALVGF